MLMSMDISGWYDELNVHLEKTLVQRFYLNQPPVWNDLKNNLWEQGTKNNLSLIVLVLLEALSM